MVKVEMVLCPDEAELVFQALDCAREVEHKASHDDDDDVSAERSKRRKGGGSPSRADGVVALAAGFLAGNAATGNGGERFQVMLHVDQDPLAADSVLGATLEDGTHVSAENLRRVACDAGVVAVSGDGAGMSVGRRTRSIPPAMRRALQLRDRGCRFPGCTHSRFLHGHHVQHWLHGGETSVENVILVCGLCRARHKVHYAASRIMPSGGASSTERKLTRAA
jgi:hypothetical protein